jgi:Glycosyl hydrolases family 18
MYLTGKEGWSTYVNFQYVDFLFVGPLGIQPKDGDFKKGDFSQGTFGLSPTLSDRFAWFVTTAKEKNKDIKIFAQQFYGSGPTQIYGTDFSQLDAKVINAYAKSVKEFVKHNDLDGYDLDYEWIGRPTVNSETGNEFKITPQVVHMIRQEFDGLKSETNKDYYVTISPGRALFLTPTDNPLTDNDIAKTYPLSESMSYINAQSYSGGWTVNGSTMDGIVQSLIRIIGPGGVLVGTWPEVPQSNYPTIKEVLHAYNNGGNHLAGIHLWRLNSHNTGFENKVQKLMHSLLCKSLPAAELTQLRKEVETAWSDGTGSAKSP